MKKETVNTNEITNVNTQISNMSEDARKRLFQAQSSGLEGVQDTNVNVRPLELKVVQKMTGEAMFEVPFDRSDYGKIFAKPSKTKDADGQWRFRDEDKLRAIDLKDIYKATLLKVEIGTEVYRNEKREGADFDSHIVYARSKETIKPQDRDAWMAIHNPSDSKEGYKYSNMVKLLMTPYSFDEVTEMMNTGRNPFVSIQLNGQDGWNTWGALNKRMTDLKRVIGAKGKLSEMLSSLFKLNITAIESGRYYQFDIDTELNDMDEALKFEELVTMLDTRFTFFYNTNDMDISLTKLDKTDREVVDATFDNVSGGEELVEDNADEPKDPLQDLPF